jgi:hypothetical protein
MLGILTVSLQAINHSPTLDSTTLEGLPSAQRQLIVRGFSAGDAARKLRLEPHRYRDPPRSFAGHGGRKDVAG